MLHYKKRNRQDEVAVERADKPGNGLWEQEQELVLKIKKHELFDPHVLLPHAELNEVVYKSTNMFLEKYKGDKMKLTILTDPVSDATQNTFREAYLAHYRDEYNKVNRFLKRRLVRSIVLMIVSLTAFVIGAHVNGYAVFLSVIVNMGAFCLWEVGYSQFAARDAIEEKRRIVRAMHAQIEFC